MSWDPDGFCKGPCQGGHNYNNSKPTGPEAEASLRRNAVATGRNPDQVVANYHAAIDSGPSLLDVAAMIIEPLDYVMTGVDIAQNGVQTEHLVAVAAPIISFGLIKAFARFTSKVDNLADDVVEKSVEAPVKPGDTGTYGELKTQKRKNGETEPLDMDHQPSFAAQVKAAEKEAGRELTDSELKKLKANTPAVASPRKIHQQTSPTYGARNTPQRIAEDAADLNAAAARDRAKFDEAMKKRE